jgi:predicted RNA-binding protein with PIN domain
VPTHLILDGYNVIRRLPRLADRERAGLEAGRRALLDRVAAYGRATGHRVTVVFDGVEEGDVVESRSRERGVEVVYTAKGTRADETIVRLARDASRGAAVVVTADRQVARDVGRNGAAVISPEAFEAKLDRVLRPAGGPAADQEPEPRDDGPDDPPRGKRGNPRKPPKAARRAAARLRTL